MLVHKFSSGRYPDYAEGLLGLSDSACYAFRSGRSFEKVSVAAGEGAPGAPGKPVVKKK
jgi:hypothetical protein